MHFRIYVCSYVMHFRVLGDVCSICKKTSFMCNIFQSAGKCTYVCVCTYVMSRLVLKILCIVFQGASGEPGIKGEKGEPGMRGEFGERVSLLHLSTYLHKYT